MALYKPGPAMLVTAAFIGPGTVTACSAAGVGFGTSLLWALVFATLATIVLQYLAARIAVVRGQGLAEAMLASFSAPAARIAVALLLIAALGIGNAAYESGNIGGAMLGAEALFGTFDSPLAVALLGGVIMLLVLAGSPRWLMRVLIALVLVMSVSFLAALAAIRPDLGALLAGLVPSIPDDGLFTAIALIGTTIVPYNLFLHAAAARNRWSGADDLAEMRRETIVSIGIGGIVSIAILATAAGSGIVGTIDNALDIARQVEPVYGAFARYAIGLGLLGAGLTSAVTAPMASGFILSELWPGNDPARKRQVFRWSAAATVAVGTLVAAAGLKPVDVILFAQVANGLLLPLVAAFLVWLSFRPGAVRETRTSPALGIAAVAVLLVCLLLGARLIARAVGVWP